MAYVFGTVLLIFIHAYGALSLTCHSSETAILEGDFSPSGDLKAGGYIFTQNYFEAVNKTHFTVCICAVKKCLHKCCESGKAYNESLKCAPTRVPTNFDVFNDQLEKLTSKPATIFQLVHGTICKKKYNLDPSSYENDLYYLLNDGTLFLPKVPANYSSSVFCVENQIIDNAVIPIVLVCFQEEEVEVFSPAYPVGVIISIPFLVITLLVYAVLPDLRNLNGKNLMSQVASMIVAYSLLAFLQLSSNEINRNWCKIAAYFMQYTFLATFFWLNVTSYDLWWTFGGFGGILLTRHRDSLKFAFYSLYAWGGPLVLIAITLALDLSPNIPSYIIQPNIGESKCWFDNNAALFAYFYGPIAAILAVNMIFFGMTAYKIFAVKQEANQVLQGDNSRRSSEATKQKFFLYLKLFFVMGVNWMMEVISAAHDAEVYKYLFIVSDVCNALQGIIIFYIFVCNQRTKKKILALFGIKKERETTTTATTVSSRQSSMVMTARNQNFEEKMPNIIDPTRRVSANERKTLPSENSSF